MYKRAHDTTYNKTWATIEDSDQPAHPRSLIRVYTDRNCLLQLPGYIQRAIKKNPCHNGWMYGLIRVFAAYTGLIVGFVVRWLTCNNTAKCHISRDTFPTCWISTQQRLRSAGPPHEACQSGPTLSTFKLVGSLVPHRVPCEASDEATLDVQDDLVFAERICNLVGNAVSRLLWQTHDVQKCTFGYKRLMKTQISPGIYTL